MKTKQKNGTYAKGIAEKFQMNQYPVLIGYFDIRKQHLDVV
jgi:hypothetical protein